MALSVLRNQVKYSSSILLSKNVIRGLTAEKILPISIDMQDIEQHGNSAKDWWNLNGPMMALHSLNEIRVPFIRDGLIATAKVNRDLIRTTEVLKDINILEVGCGGGILTEALARLSANVTGIDPGEEVIKTAKEHLKNHSPLLQKFINYSVESIEEHASQNNNKYDAVVLSEVIEHVNEKKFFLAACVNTLKPGGSIFITTFNKTFLAWITAIFIAENIIKLVPKGTHNYEKLISPIELQRVLESLNCTTILVNGYAYEFWRNSWIWITSNNLCYALHSVKNV